MSDKTPGERAFDKFFETMAYPRPNLGWADSSSRYKAAWEAAAEEGHVAHILRVSTMTQAKLDALQPDQWVGFFEIHESPKQTKPEIDYLAINRSCS